MSTQRDTTAFNSIWRFGDHAAVPVLGHVLPDRAAAGFLQPIAWILPLWHGVDLAGRCRSGRRGAAALMAAHLVILLAMAIGGAIATFVMFKRKLER